MIAEIIAIILIFFLAIIRGVASTFWGLVLNIFLIIFLYKRIKKEIHMEGFLGLHLIAALITVGIFIMFGSSSLFPIFLKFQIIELTLFLVLAYLISVLIKS